MELKDLRHLLTPRSVAMRQIGPAARGDSTLLSLHQAAAICVWHSSGSAVLVHRAEDGGRATLLRCRDSPFVVDNNAGGGFGGPCSGSARARLPAGGPCSAPALHQLQRRTRALPRAPLRRRSGRQGPRQAQRRRVRVGRLDRWAPGRAWAPAGAPGRLGCSRAPISCVPAAAPQADVFKGAPCRPHSCAALLQLQHVLGGTCWGAPAAAAVPAPPPWGREPPNHPDPGHHLPQVPSARAAPCWTRTPAWWSPSGPSGQDPGGRCSSTHRR
jgi:hypothetical protein